MEERQGKGRWWVDGERGLSLCIGAVLVRRRGAGRQVVERGGGLVLIAVAAGRHPLVDAVQASSLLEALDLVLRVEALDGCKEMELALEQSCSTGGRGRERERWRERNSLT